MNVHKAVKISMWSRKICEKYPKKRVDLMRTPNFQNLHITRRMLRNSMLGPDSTKNLQLLTKKAEFVIVLKLPPYVREMVRLSYKLGVLKIFSRRDRPILKPVNVPDPCVTR